MQAPTKVTHTAKVPRGSGQNRQSKTRTVTESDLRAFQKRVERRRAKKKRK